MIDLFGILTRAMLGLAPTPAPAAKHITPVVAAPAAAAPAAAPQPPAKAPTSANEIVDQVQKFYANIKQVTASFRQTVKNETFGSTKDSDGKVWIMKPGKMRWDYLEKKKDQVVVKKSFISNGSNLYVVEHDNMQVVKKNLQQDLMPVAVSFLYGKGDLKTEFNAALDTSNAYAAKGEVAIKLTPKKPSAQYKSLVLIVSPTDYHVTQSIIVDSSNNMNQFRFFAPDFKQSLQDTLFEFDEKSARVKNYRIVDADQQGQGSGSAAPAPAPKK